MFSITYVENDESYPYRTSSFPYIVPITINHLARGLLGSIEVEVGGNFS